MLYKVPTQNSLQYTLDAQLAAGATSLTLNQSVAGVVQAPGVCWIDRVDASGNKTASKREYLTFTGVSGAQLTGLTRGLAGSTDQVHSVGAIVEFGPDVIQSQGIYDALTFEHSGQGVHASLISLSVVKTLDAVIASAASAALINVRTLGVASLASIQSLAVGSLTGVITGLHPTFALRGVISGASTSIGGKLPLPEAGTILSVAIGLDSPVSVASTLFDINLNGVSIFTDQNTRPLIVSGGTYVSTASIGTTAFLAGGLLSVDQDAPLTFVKDPNIVISTR